tara:strand:+ start:283 stop:387 length:105 start_codon:yes stop_codon:yes gene_type:complete
MLLKYNLTLLKKTKNKIKVINKKTGVLKIKLMIK